MLGQEVRQDMGFPTTESERAMAMEPDEPREKPAAPRDLAPMSIGELKDYIESLRAEIARAEATIKAKEAHRSGIESVFRS